MSRYQIALPILALALIAVSLGSKAAEFSVLASELPAGSYAPNLPDLDAIRQRLTTEQPPTTSRFYISIDRIADNKRFSSSYVRDLEDLLDVPMGEVLGLHLRRGVVDLEVLSRSLADPEILKCVERVCTLRAPLIIDEAAGLLIRGTSASPLILHLSHQGAAYLGSSGLLWLEHAEIAAFDEATGAARATPGSFRGFILATEGSRTVIRDSWLHDLGYAGSMAYGLSLAVGDRSEPATIDNPHGSIFRSRLDRLYYAFYSYQAHDVQLIDNSITDSWKYGIDPHDDSLRILIAGNRVEGTRTVETPGKPSGGHGIIISRRVNDSWILENESHGNAKSGLVVDKQCDNVAIAGNHASGNGDDGLTIYEGSNIWIQGNRFAGNGDSAIRVRSSQHITVMGNDLRAHPGYCLKITGKGASAFQSDLYLGGNSCEPDTRLLRIENVQRLDMEADAFGPLPSVEMWRINGPDAWREAIADHLTSGTSVRLEQADIVPHD